MNWNKLLSIFCVAVAVVSVVLLIVSLITESYILTIVNVFNIVTSILNAIMFYRDS